METKPGIKTTEFWLTLASLVLGALISLGVIDTGQADDIAKIATPLITAALPVIMYIWSRTKVKSANK